MRFFADGPAIPDALLVARDEGQVLFFCGSGVSLARAGLPNFFGLADKVIEALGTATASRARAVVEASRAVGRIDGVGSLVAADRVFSLLEEEFSVAQVRQKVAEALRPERVDLSAHRIILDLACGTDGAVRLVTTNFDLLFEACDPHLASHSAPDLPDPARPNRFTGIVHLHGRITEDHAVPEDEEFVLSSADFGRAYLADGWATRFMRALVERYQLVFLGYAADDPPVQYLLEALGRDGSGRNRIFAFQAGGNEQAKALWRYRGVEAIAYDEADGHAALWRSLEAWAERARDPGAWIDRLLRQAAQGPARLAPHERGQVAHIVSSVEGAKLLDRGNIGLSAEWLCVFEPHLRYGEPGRVGYDPDDELIDPFSLWGLDDDEVPPPYDPNVRQTRKRDVPAEAWSAFTLTRQDRVSLEERAGPTFYGPADQQVARLPPRLDHIGNWIATLCEQPAALWWAAGMTGLHPHIAQKIAREIEKRPDPDTKLLRDGWRYLLTERGARHRSHPTEEFYRLDDAVKQDGWTLARVRLLADLRRPELEIRRAWMSYRPPERIERLSDVLRIELNYRDADVLREVPPDFVLPYCRQLSEAIAAACSLEIEMTGSIYALGPFTRTGDGEDEAPGYIGNDLTDLFRTWISALSRANEEYPEFIRGELLSWRQRPEAPFVRASIWAAGLRDTISADMAGKILAGLGRANFWDPDHQRDLLHRIAERWGELPHKVKEAIGAQILEGPEPWESEPPEEQARRAAWYSLQRIHWLRNRGCDFLFDIDAETARLREIQPDWSADDSPDADESQEMRVRSITQDTDPKELLDIPIEEVVARAADLSRGRIDRFMEPRPFVGLATNYADRALAALKAADAATSGWAWSLFLGIEARADDPTPFVTEIGKALLAIDISNIAPILREMIRWFDASQERLRGEDAVLFEALWNRSLESLEANPDKARSAIVVNGGNHDWNFEAINSPAGTLAERAVLYSDPHDPSASLDPLWLGRLAMLLGLAGDAGRYALVIVLRNINFLYRRAPEWADRHLLKRRFLSDDDRWAFWAGMFRSNGLSADLAVILNPEIVDLASERHDGRGWSERLAAFLLGGWSRDDLRTDGSAIASYRFREALLAADEELRLQVLGTAQRWLVEPGRTWNARAEELLASVWPRQNLVRSPRMSAAIARFIMAGGPIFPALLRAGADLLDKLAGEGVWTFHVEGAVQLAVDYPHSMLDLLMAIMSENAAEWPYRIDRLLDVLAAGPFAQDPRLQELRRRWAAR
jgi:hypothetical protein